MLTMSCSAELRLDRALGRRYRWPVDFDGFEATATLADGGGPSVTHRGVVRVPARGPVSAPVPELQVAVDRFVDGLRRPWVLQACLPWPKQVVEVATGPGEVVEVADPAHTILRLHDDQLVEVGRDVGEVRVSWRIDRWHDAPGGRVLPASMLVSVDDRVTGRPRWFERVNDEFDDLDGVWVPSRRRTVRWVDQRRLTTDLRLLVPTRVR